MPKLEDRLTTTRALKLPVPPPPSPPSKKNYEIYWCKDTEGFGIRVTVTGARSWVGERRINGETVRRTLGKAKGRGAISDKVAREQLLVINGELQQGVDRVEQRRAETKENRLAISLAKAVRDFVDGKRRAKDGLPLKERTKSEYLAMVQGDQVGKTGKPLVDGELYPLASRRLDRITGDEIRELWEQLQRRGKTRAEYAMRVLRSVLNWHGVSVPGNPFSNTMPGRDRIMLPTRPGKPRPLPAERLGAFWHHASAISAGNGKAAGSADLIRFILLTGGRGGESAGNKFEDGILVRDFDTANAQITLKDTKNRTDHVLHLSSQALEIALKHARGKRSNQRLFSIRNPGATLDRICQLAGFEPRTPHELRKTFASVAEDLVSVYTLKGMINHTHHGDVTGSHYIEKTENQLRRGWQTVADFYEDRANQYRAQHGL